jgi:hypothetical protein
VFLRRRGDVKQNERRGDNTESRPLLMMMDAESGEQDSIDENKAR